MGWPPITGIPPVARLLTPNRVLELRTARRRSMEAAVVMRFICSLLSKAIRTSPPFIRAHLPCGSCRISVERPALAALCRPQPLQVPPYDRFDPPFCSFDPLHRLNTCSTPVHALLAEAV
jgi:hypothetical protein